MRSLCSSAAVVALMAAGALSSPSFAAERPSVFLAGSVRSAEQVLAQADQSNTAEGTAPAAASGDAAAAGDADSDDVDDPDDPVDSRAIEALLKMGDELVKLQEFAIRMDGTVEQVMDSGQKMEFGGTAFYRVSRPDRFRIDFDTDTGDPSSYYYDGKTLTLSTPLKGVYGQAEGKPTIRETIQWMEDTYGIETPLADLFDWGGENPPVDEINDATSAGYARINGVLCGHFAFRTDEVDWEVWIETGSRPLTLKFVITDKTQDALPRFSATLKWSTSENFEDQIFEFSPPPDAKKIPLTPLSEMAKLDGSDQ